MIEPTTLFVWDFLAGFATVSLFLIAWNLRDIARELKRKNDNQ